MRGIKSPYPTEGASTINVSRNSAHDAALKLLRKRFFCFAILLGSFPAVKSNADAQIAMTDPEVRERGATSLIVEYMHVSSLTDARGWTLYTARSVVGVGRGVEVSAGFSFFPGDAVQPLAANPGIKWRMLNQEKSWISAAIGATAFISLASVDHKYESTWGAAYGVVEHSFGEKRATVGVGAYALAQAQQAAVNRIGVTVALSQPIAPGIDVGANWVSGNNVFGYLSPGAAFTRGPYSLWLGYSRGTNPHGNSGPAISFERSL
ncbi:MAG: hypothetical protein ABJB66_02240 [Gemmatimonadaceae bacterium]